MHDFDFLHQKLRSSTDIQLWFEYATLVKDQDVVLEHMLTFAPEDQQPKILFTLAMYYECYCRDYLKANECYLRAQPHLVKKHQEFGQRI